MNSMLSDVLVVTSKSERDRDSKVTCSTSITTHE